MAYLVKYYMDNNLGDDLFIESLKTVKNSRFKILKKKNYLVNHDLLDADNIICEEKKAVNEIPFLYEGIIFIGGSIFQEGSFKNFLGHIKRLLAIFIYRVLGKKVYIIGSNITEIGSFAHVFIFWLTINLVNRITVRDNKSFEILSRWGLKQNADLYPDVVYSININYSINKDEILGISIINTNDKRTDQYVKNIVEIINNTSYRKIRIFCFDSGEESDIVIANKIKQLINKDVEIFEYSPSIKMKFFLEKYAECKTVVIGRFHSLVLSSMYKQRIIPLIYSQKVKNLLNDLEFTGPYQLINDSNLDHNSYEILLKDNIIKMAHNHFKVLG